MLVGQHVDVTDTGEHGRIESVRFCFCGTRVFSVNVGGLIEEYVEDRISLSSREYRPVME